MPLHDTLINYALTTLELWQPLPLCGCNLRGVEPSERWAAWTFMSAWNRRLVGLLRGERARN